MADTAGLYLYGVLGADPCLGEIIAEPVALDRRADPCRIDLADLGTLSVLTSPIERANVRRTRRNLLAHTRVLEAAMQHATVLPMRFGVICDNRDLLAEALLPRQEELLDLLTGFSGRHELGVRVQWDRDKCLADILVGRPDIAARHQALIGRKGGYQEKIALGQQVAEAVEAWRKAIEQDLLSALKAHCKQYALKLAENDTEVLRADFLVTAAEEVALMETLDAWIAAQDGKATAHCIGPAPVFNFVSLNLDLPGQPARDVA